VTIFFGQEVYVYHGRGKRCKIAIEREMENMCWWSELGYPSFEEGKGGFPRTGQVVKHYRENKMDDAGRAWTQKRLAEVLDVTEKTNGTFAARKWLHVFS
jgi:hypothetical protein